MEQDQFDRIVRTLGSATTRRAGIGAAIAGAFGFIALTDNARSRRSPEPSGPCGDGSGQSNRCTSNKDCCTNYCDTAARRCRCIARGAACKSNQSCCAGNACHNGVCSNSGPNPTTTPRPTKTPVATATPTNTVVPTATPTGTLTPSPTPAPTNTPIPSGCDVDPGTDIGVAIALAPEGGTITLGPGTHTLNAGGLTIDKSITLEACSSAGGNAGNTFLLTTNATSITSNVAPTSVTFRNLTLRGASTDAGKDGLDIIGSDSDATLDGVVVDGFTGDGVSVRAGGLVAMKSSFTNSQVGVRLVGDAKVLLSTCTFDGKGTGPLAGRSAIVYSGAVDGTAAQSSVTASTIRNYTSDGSSGYTSTAILMAPSETSTLTLELDSVTLTDNVSNRTASIRAGDGAFITLKGTTTFIDNSSLNNSAGVSLRVGSNDTSKAWASLRVMGNDVVFRRNANTGGGSDPDGGAIDIICSDKKQIDFSRVQAATYTNNSPIACSFFTFGSKQTVNVPNCNYDNI